MKIAKPNGLIVKCPHCGNDNEIDWDELHRSGLPCQYAHCGKEFATCCGNEFIEYIKNGSKAT